jgi:hypothetical protein
MAGISRGRLRRGNADTLERKGQSGRHHHDDSKPSEKRLSREPQRSGSLDNKSELYRRGVLQDKGLPAGACRQGPAGWTTKGSGGAGNRLSAIAATSGDDRVHSIMPDMCHERKYTAGVVGCAKSPCEPLRLGTGVRGDFAHVVEFSGSLPRAQNRAGPRRARRDFRTRFCTPYAPPPFPLRA